MPKIPALPFVRSSVTQGLSANQAYKQYRNISHEAGGQGIRRQDFLRLYSETRAARGNVAAAMVRPKDTIPSASEIVNRTTVNAKGYGQWVAIHQRTRGQSDHLFNLYLVKTDKPITPAEAESRALDFLTSAPDEYDRVTLGVGYVGTELFTPKQ